MQYKTPGQSMLGITPPNKGIATARMVGALAGLVGASARAYETFSEPTTSIEAGKAITAVQTGISTMASKGAADIDIYKYTQEQVTQLEVELEKGTIPSHIAEAKIKTYQQVGIPYLNKHSQQQLERLRIDTINTTAKQLVNNPLLTDWDTINKSLEDKASTVNLTTEEYRVGVYQQLSNELKGQLSREGNVLNVDTFKTRLKQHQLIKDKIAPGEYADPKVVSEYNRIDNTYNSAVKEVKDLLATKEIVPIKGAIDDISTSNHLEVQRHINSLATLDPDKAESLNKKYTKAYDDYTQQVQVKQAVANGDRLSADVLSNSTLKKEAVKQLRVEVAKSFLSGDMDTVSNRLLDNIEITKEVADENEGNILSADEGKFKGIIEVYNKLTPTTTNLMYTAKTQEYMELIPLIQKYSTDDKGAVLDFKQAQDLYFKGSRDNYAPTNDSKSNRNTALVNAQRNLSSSQLQRFTQLADKAYNLTGNPKVYNDIYTKMKESTDTVSGVKINKEYGDFKTGAGQQFQPSDAYFKTIKEKYGDGAEMTVTNSGAVVISKQDPIFGSYAVGVLTGEEVSREDTILSLPAKDEIERAGVGMALSNTVVGLKKLGVRTGEFFSDWGKKLLMDSPTDIENLDNITESEILQHHLEENAKYPNPLPTNVVEVIAKKDILELRGYSKEKAMVEAENREIYGRVIKYESSGKDHLVPYKDSKGIPTIGHGLNLTDLDSTEREILGIPSNITNTNEVVKYLEDNPIGTHQQASLLNYSIKQAREDVEAVYPGGTTKDEDLTKLLVDMDFNMGRTRLQFPMAMKAYKEGDTKEFIKQLKDSNYYTKDLPNNKERYKYITGLMQSVQDRDVLNK